MACTLQVAWDERLAAYDFGPGHPLAPVRVELTIQLARALGLLAEPGVSVEQPLPASDDELELVHDPAYIAAVRAAGGGSSAGGGSGSGGSGSGGSGSAGESGSAGGAGSTGGSGAGGPSGWLRFGLGTPDDPVFAGMHEASALVAGATLAAARAVWAGTSEHAASIAGGLHHAMRASASGFCVYNDPAIAIAWLLRAGAERIAYVDIDVHHGDGVQAAFYDDPRVLTVSLHETPALLFPGTGRPGETGGPGAEGAAVNVALPPGTGDAAWLRAFHAVAVPLVRAFAPQILVSQHGCDTHRLDPLAHLELTIDGQAAAHAAIHRLAHENAGGRWLLTGGGGYELVQVVPRTWTRLLFEAAGRPVDPDTPTPASWRDYVSARTGRRAPELLTEGAPGSYVPFESGHDALDPVDQAILATQAAVFPAHGLTPAR